MGNAAEKTVQLTGTGVRTRESFPASRSAVTTRRIYFGHQSVGNEIIAGIESLQSNQRPRLNLVQTKDLVAVAGPALVHFLVGRNEDPTSKNEEFLRVLDARPKPDHPIALLKYCFVDAKSPQDAPSIFEGYRRTVDAIHRRHPDVTVVHVTMPLTTTESAFRARVKRWLGRQVNRDLSIKRQAYNALLRATYEGREPIFDIAEVESSRDDGSRSFFMNAGDTVFTMAPEYTYDGGHLNELGRKRVATHFLDILARLAPSTAVADAH